MIRRRADLCRRCGGPTRCPSFLPVRTLGRSPQVGELGDRADVGVGGAAVPAVDPDRPDPGAGGTEHVRRPGVADVQHPVGRQAQCGQRRLEDHPVRLVRPDVLAGDDSRRRQGVVADGGVQVVPVDVRDDAVRHLEPGQELGGAGAQRWPAPVRAQPGAQPGGVALDPGAGQRGGETADAEIPLGPERRPGHGVQERPPPGVADRRRVGRFRGQPGRPLADGPHHLTVVVDHGAVEVHQQAVHHAGRIPDLSARGAARTQRTARRGRGGHRGG